MGREQDDKFLMQQATSIVIALIDKKSIVDAKDALDLIDQVYDRISSKVHIKTPTLIPAIPIEKSITPDFIICLEDGKKFKSLKRHLRTSYDLSPDQYREKWGLPGDYPMTAPTYSEQRSKLAKKIGLGQTDASPRKKPATRKSKPKGNGAADHPHNHSPPPT